MRVFSRIALGIAAVAAITASMVTPAQAAEAPLRTNAFQIVDFSCAAASSIVWCDNIGINGSIRLASFTSSIDIYIDNPAAGGERCQLRIVRPDGVSTWTRWVDLYAAAGDNYAVMVTNVAAGSLVDLRCVRRGSSGDAGIGGSLGIYH
jgi:hypothetical protein